MELAEKKHWWLEIEKTLFLIRLLNSSIQVIMFHVRRCPPAQEQPAVLQQHYPNGRKVDEGEGGVVWCLGYHYANQPNLWESGLVFNGTSREV